jgi:hypothetical protein
LVTHMLGNAAAAGFSPDELIAELQTHRTEGA